MRKRNENAYHQRSSLASGSLWGLFKCHHSKKINHRDPIGRSSSELHWRNTKTWLSSHEQKEEGFRISMGWARSVTKDRDGDRFELEIRYTSTNRRRGRLFEKV